MTTSGRPTSRAEIERLGRRAVLEEVDHELREATRTEDLVRCGQLRGCPPAQLGDVLRGQVEPRRRLERLDADEVAALALPAVLAPGEVELVLAAPEQRADLEVVQAELLCKLAPEGVPVALARIDAAAGRRPRERLEVVLDEEHAVGRVENERPGGLAPVDQVVERAEPAQPLGVRDGGVRRRGRGEDEERGA